MKKAQRRIMREWALCWKADRRLRSYPAAIALKNAISWRELSNDPDRVA